MEYSLNLGLFIFFITFLGFFVKGIAGFGDPLITSPLLSIKLENKMISPMNLCFSIPINGYMAWQNRKGINLSQIIPMTVSILIGVIPGTLMLKYATSWVLKAALGVLIIIIGVEMLTRDRSGPSQPNTVIMLIVSFLSGVTAGLFGINLFFVAYIERTTKTREAFRGSMTFVFLVENVFRAVIYIITGVLNFEVLKLTLFALPGVVAGFLVGSRVDKKLSEKTIRRIVIAVFMLSGINILLRALILKQ